jgi:zinc transport system substrate-binding protein
MAKKLVKKLMYKTVVFLLLFLFSCSKKVQQDAIITVTIEPQRFFVEQLTDTLFRVISMVPSGSSPETYDPTPGQMVELAHSKAYFGIGRLGFEEIWLDKLKENFPQVAFFDNSKGISFISSEHRHKNDVHHPGGVDPHIWSSPKEALTIVRNMYDAVVEIDPANKDFYASNLQKLSDYIQDVDKKITALLKNSSQKTFIIYHPALAYFARNYGLTQYCIETDGKEPSPEQMERLIKIAREKAIKTIFVQQEFDTKNATAIAREAGCNLVVINTLSYNWGMEMLHIAKTLSNE